MKTLKEKELIAEHLGVEIEDLCTNCEEDEIHDSEICIGCLEEEL
jgi:hypothetical protein